MRLALLLACAGLMACAEVAPPPPIDLSKGEARVLTFDATPRLPQRRIGIPQVACTEVQPLIAEGYQFVWLADQAPDPSDTPFEGEARLFRDVEEALASGFFAVTRLKRREHRCGLTDVEPAIVNGDLSGSALFSLQSIRIERRVSG
ncbi:MAG: hypothetical protein AAFR46_02860 [Pseudomonadota bacterium]